MALNIERYDYEQLAHGKMQSVWDMSSTTLKTIVRFSYERYDGIQVAPVSFGRFDTRKFLT